MQDKIETFNRFDKQTIPINTRHLSEIEFQINEWSLFLMVKNNPKF